MSKSLQIRDIPSLRPLLCLGGHVPVSEVMQKMVKSRVTAVCIMRRGKLDGIFTMTDIMKKVLGYKASSMWKSPRKRKIRDVAIRALMTGDPVTVDPYTLVDDAVAMMKAKKIKHLPVIENGEVTRVVSITDIVRAMRAADKAEVKDRRQAFRLKEHLLNLNNLYAQPVAAHISQKHKRKI